MFTKTNLTNTAIARFQVASGIAGFYHTLKVALIYGQRYQIRDEAQFVIFDYIEVFYNKLRLHSQFLRDVETNTGDER